MSKEVELTCPICQSIKAISIPEAIFTQKKFGTIKLQVPAGGICPDHQFIAFVDVKGIVRGYEKIDIHMSVPATVTKEEVEKMEELTLGTVIQMFGPYGAFSILHAKLFNYPCYIMKPKGFKEITDLMNNFFDNFIPEEYSNVNHIKTVNEEDYKFKSDPVSTPQSVGGGLGSDFSFGSLNIDYSKIRLKEKNAFFIDSQRTILQTPWSEKLKFEESIFNKALEISDPQEQSIIIKQDVNKFIKEAKQIVNILEGVKEIYEDDLIDQLSKDLNIPKINHYRLSIIKDFVKQRISTKLPSKIKNKVEEFLNLL